MFPQTLTSGNVRCDNWLKRGVPEKWPAVDGSEKAFCLNLRKATLGRSDVTIGGAFKTRLDYELVRGIDIAPLVDTLGPCDGQAFQKSRPR